MRFCFHHGDRPLAGYTILRGLGRGSFSEVYLAVSDGGKEVALKAILDRPEIERRGIAACINFSHPHLVSIHDVRTAADGTLFVIMEYASGTTLRDLIERHPAGLPAAEAVEVCRQIAGGLGALHAAGIVHRDLKPENIFWDEGAVKIGDYGLAKRIGASSRCGHTTGVGTIAYMAPEVMEGRYGPAADLYALGAILHELLTGRPLFPGATHAEVLAKHLAAAPDLESVPPRFRAAIARAVAKRPEDRFGSAGELVEALAASGLTPPPRAETAAPPPPPAPPFVEDARTDLACRLWTAAALAAALVLFLIPLCSTASWESWHRPVPPTVSAPLPALEVQGGSFVDGLLARLERRPPAVVEPEAPERPERLRRVSRLAGRASRAVVRRVAVWIRGGEAAGGKEGEPSLESVLVEIAGDSSARITEALTCRLLSRFSPRDP